MPEPSSSNGPEIGGRAITDLKVTELKEELTKLDIKPLGNKSELQKLLTQALKKEKKPKGKAAKPAKPVEAAASTTSGKPTRAKKAVVSAEPTIEQMPEPSSSNGPEPVEAAASTTSTKPTRAKKAVVSAEPTFEQMPEPSSSNGPEIGGRAITDLKVTELKEELAKLDIKPMGNKSELQKLLTEALKKEKKPKGKAAKPVEAAASTTSTKSTRAKKAAASAEPTFEQMAEPSSSNGLEIGGRAITDLKAAKPVEAAASTTSTKPTRAKRAAPSAEPTFEQMAEPSSSNGLEIGGRAITDLKVTELKEELAKLDIKPMGNKSELQKLLIQALKGEKEAHKEKKKAGRPKKDAPAQPVPTKKLKTEAAAQVVAATQFGKIITIGTSPIAGELGPQKKTFNDLRVRPHCPRLIEYDGENGVTMLASGAFHNIFIDNDGCLRTFGCNDDGALGRNTKSDDSDDDEYEEKTCLNPGLVEFREEDKDASRKFTKVAAGDMFSIALDDKGNVFAFGNIKDESNKLGLFQDTPVLEEMGDDGKPFKTSNYLVTKFPKKIDLHDEPAIDIAAGAHHIVILTSNGDVFTFGEGSKGQLGRIKQDDLETIKVNRSRFLAPYLVTFKPKEANEKIVKVFAGQYSSYAVTSLGNLYAWGLNNYYQLGFESTTRVILPGQPDVEYSFELKPVKVQLPFKVKELSLGQQHLLILDTQGNVHACGNGHYGKLGHSRITNKASVEDFKTPQLIGRERFNGEEITSVTCGDFFSLALGKSGTVFVWGQASGATGIPDGDENDGNDIYRPKNYEGPVIAAHRITQLSAGSNFAAFIGVRN